ncbi:MAG: fructose-bisphosphate aldolase, partial [Candidatus Pacearchaeota archaeon]
IAKISGVKGIILHKGIVEKYIYNLKVPLILKLNGKTNLFKGEPISRQICSVERAKELGAVGVGYTIYLGSEYEREMLMEFGRIQEEAHKKGLFVIAWMYPRGKSIKKVTPPLVEYAARVGLEIGADFVKIPFTNKEHFKRVVKVAGKCKVLALGGEKKELKQFLREVKEIKEAGACGLAVGRNVWQNDEPLKVVSEIKRILEIS